MRALLVYKKSAYQLHLERKNPRDQELIDSGDPCARSWVPSHETHVAAVDAVGVALKAAGYRVSRTYRARLGQITGFDLIVAVGGDGTLLDVSHHLRTQTPLLGVNSDPQHSVGLLAAAHRDNLGPLLDDIAAGRLRATPVARLALELEGEAVPVLALNDVLVAHSHPASTSRYLLKVGRRSERQRSSGVWIASAVGSTAAIRSAGGEVRPLTDAHIQYRVREPSAVQPPQLVSGLVSQRSALHVHSAMRGGRIYVDGPYTRYPFRLGAHLVVRLVPRSLALYLTEENLARRQGLS